MLSNWMNSDFLRWISGFSESLLSVVTYVLQLNYFLVTTVLSGSLYVITGIFNILSSTFIICGDFVASLTDFLLELSKCIGSLCVFTWKGVVVVLKTLSLMLSGLEATLYWIWFGVKCFTLKVCERLTEIYSSGNITSRNFVKFLSDVVALFISGLTTLGSMWLMMFRFGMDALCQTYEFIVQFFHWIDDSITHIIDTIDFTVRSIFTYHLFNMPKETYLGIMLCIFIYVVTTNTFKFLHSRGMTFPMFNSRSRRHPGRVDPMNNRFMYEFSDVEDLADEYDEFESQTEGSLSETNDGGSFSGGDTSEEDQISDNSDFDSESSEDSINVDLPEVSSFTHQCRSSTPSSIRNNLTSEEYSREMEAERDKRKCVVCQDLNKSVLLLPCKHMCLCVDCANKIVKSRLTYRRVCPLCRKRIETVMNVYV